jgi:hypothetical protein
VVQACHRNFLHTAPDPDCILDQTTLSAMLLAVDAAEGHEARAPGSPAMHRKPDQSHQPHQPDLPDPHDRPDQPNQPDLPGQHDRPDQPDLPGQVIPGEPGQRVELARLLAELAAI